MLIDELDRIVHRAVDDDNSAVIDVSTIAGRIVAELPARLSQRFSHREICDRVFIVATRKAVRGQTLSRMG